MIKEIVNKNWGKTLQISNEKITLEVTLDFGPRIISYKLNGEENMFLEDRDCNISVDIKNDEMEGTWKIYGGHRLWHSPESMPRSYFPDNNTVSYHTEGDTVWFETQMENWVQVTKSLGIQIDENSSQVKIIHKIQNNNAWDIELSLWALTVMAPGGFEILPQPDRETGLLGNRVLALWPYTNMNDNRVYWGDKYITLSQDANAHGPIKFGINNEKQWAAYINKGCLFIKKYSHNMHAKYPDFGVSYETYTNKYFLEMESLFHF